MKIKFSIILLSLALIAKAQNRSHLGLFPTIDHSGTINKKFDYSLYYFAAFNLINSKINTVKEPANFFVFYAEQALTYKINPNLSFTASYVFEKQYPTGKNYRNENRFYLQSTYKYNLNRTTLKHRLRFDGRYIQDNSNGKAQFTNRIRYLFGIKTPLSKKEDKLYINIYNEFFFNTHKTAAIIYDENWAYAGIGYKTNNAGAFEAGPLYIFWVNNGQNNLTNFLYLQLTWATNINLSKK